MRRENSRTRPGIVWQVADIFNMPQIPSHSFDIVVDKAVIDSVLFRQPSNQRESLGSAALREIERVLVDSGVYFVVTPRKRFRSMLPGLQQWERLIHESIDDDHLVVVRSESQALSSERKTVWVQAFRKPH